MQKLIKSSISGIKKPAGDTYKSEGLLSDLRKQNCWEFMRCGKLSCPTKTETRLNGIHGGKNAGRACWAVAGTLCGNKIHGEFAIDKESCMSCDFYQYVLREENFSGSFVNFMQIRDMIKSR